MSNNKYKVLLVEDDRKIRNLVKTILETSDYQVILAETCSLAQSMYTSYIPDIIILDLGLPDRDGSYFLDSVRQTSHVPVIILSARFEEQDKVAALDAGANDYITKPFGSAELLARVRTALRSARQNQDSDNCNGKFIMKNLMIDYGARRVFISNEEIRLTQTEYNIIAFLSLHSGKMMTYSSIIKAIWGCPDEGSIKKLQVNMANIRKKIGSRTGKAGYIINELGVGYRMDGEMHNSLCNV